MEIISYDEAKDEVERLLLTPIQIGTTWRYRHDPPDSCVIVQGFVNRMVTVKTLGGIGPSQHIPVIAFLASHTLIPF